MIRILSLAFVLALVTGFSGCSNVAPWDSAPFGHAVFFKFKANATEAQRADMLRDVRDLLAPIPSVKGIWAGQPAATGNMPFVDTAYDVGIFITFADQKGLAAYDAHPRHGDFVKKYLDQVEVRVFDFSPKGDMKP